MMVTVVVGSHRPLPEPTGVMSRAANATKALRFRTTARLYAYDTLLDRLAQDLEHMTVKLGEFTQEAHSVVGQRDFARHRHVAAVDQPFIRDGVVGSATRRVVTNAVRSPVRPAMLWIRVVSIASARGIAGRMVVSRRASIDLPAPGAPSKWTLWSKHPHRF